MIIAQSARALVQSAVKAGWKVHAIDQFGDLDTRAATIQCEVIGSFDNSAAVLAALERLLGKHQLDFCIAGGGLESALELLNIIDRRLPLKGSSLEIYHHLCDPASFCKLLDALGIAHPETVFNGPAPAADWLAKRIGGSGGGHVRLLAVGESPGTGCYRQRRVEGVSASTLFLANGRKAQVLGYTRHWQAQLDPDRPYRRSGLIRWPTVPAPAQIELKNIVDKITDAIGLSGLCGLDFVLGEDGQIVVLEINPRPPASFELHEGEGSLLEAHRRACDGELIPPPPAPASTVKASVVLYAAHLLTVPADFSWPEWCADIPAAGSVIGQDRPVCSVMATTTSMQAAQALAQKQILALQAELMRFQPTT